MGISKWLTTQWDRGLAVVVVLAALVFLLAGWLGISRTEYPAEQLPYVLSGGIAAVILAGIGVGLWLSADLRDEWRKLDRIDEALRELRGTSLVAAGKADEAEAEG